MKIVLIGDSIRVVGYGPMLEERLKKAGFEVFQPEDNCRFAQYTLRLLFDLKEQIKDQYAPGETSNVAGKINVCESSTPAAWGPARKVWNQWPYNVVNINEDMSVPKYQFNITHVFGNG